MDFPNCPRCGTNDYDTQLDPEETMELQGFLECFCIVGCGAVFRFNKHGIAGLEDGECYFLSEAIWYK